MTYYLPSDKHSDLHSTDEMSAYGLLCVYV